MQLSTFLKKELVKIKKANLYRKLPENKTGLNFASNNYLGFGYGAEASRLVTGNHEKYQKLEELIARWKKSAAALVFPTGFMTNLGTITALLGKGDLIIIDKLNHASIIDACFLSGADIRVYKHKDMQNLEKILKTSVKKYLKKIIITETVFSMDGDRAPLKEIVKLAKKYGCWTYVDEAHAVGVLGKTGAGLCEELGIENQIDIKMGTLSKAVSSIGGYVAGSKRLIDFLINKARPFIYTTALPAAVAKQTTLNLQKLIKATKKRQKLWQNIDYFYKTLTQKAPLAKGAFWTINKPESAIIPIIVGDEKKALQLSKKLQKKGFVIPAIRYPTVPKGKARLRCTLTAKHTKQQIERLIQCML